MLLLLLCVTVTLTQKCHTTNKTVASTLQHSLASSLNRLRSQIATGQVSFENSSRSSNMNVMHWSDGLARRGQQCAERCPAKPDTCVSHQDYGVLNIQIPLNSQKSAAKVIDYWFQDNYKAKQLLTARQSHFGCGKAQDDKIEYVVCFFDKKHTHQVPFLDGPTGSACKMGMSKVYPGLCATGSHTMIQKNKIDIDTTEMLIAQNQRDFV